MVLVMPSMSTWQMLQRRTLQNVQEEDCVFGS